MLVTTVRHLTDGYSRVIIRRMSCIGVSAWSTRTISDGRKEAIWRTISEPMDPAAPVIRMRRPLRRVPMAPISTSIFSRGRRSSISTSWSWLCVTGLFPSHSSALDIIIMRMPWAIRSSIIPWFERMRSVFRGDTRIARTPSRLRTSPMSGPFR